MARPENLIRHNCTCTRFLWEMVNSKVARLSAINLPFDINRYAWINFVSSTIYFNLLYIHNIFSIHKVRLLTCDNSLIRFLRNILFVFDHVMKYEYFDLVSYVFWFFVLDIILQFFKVWFELWKNWNDNNMMIRI